MISITPNHSVSCCHCHTLHGFVHNPTLHLAKVFNRVISQVQYADKLSCEIKSHVHVVILHGFVHDHTLNLAKRFNTINQIWVLYVDKRLWKFAEWITKMFYTYHYHIFLDITVLWKFCNFIASDGILVELSSPTCEPTIGYGHLSL